MPIGSGGSCIVSSPAHLTHVSALSGPSNGSYPASYPGRSAEEPTRCPGFLLPFRPPAFASWVILRPLRSSAFLTVGLPDTEMPDPIGVVMLRMSKTRRGRTPP
jgi:hypothetical protein